ncbi:MAG: sodium:proton antiporter [Bacteroidetes bacterium]|nr:sodium:proton antiporter [Bacteroidota bacterium]NCQ10872.1 sodium:proton antiporter [Bacteroidota bacterium]
MTIPIIITISILLLLAYVFDITSSKTKVPSVILLLFLGWVVKQVSFIFSIVVPDLAPILPFLGAIGLILIVLEGSLELEFNKSKLNYIGKSSIIALIPMLIFSFSLAVAFMFWGNVGFKIGLANAIPFAIVSSAIAISSAQNLLPKNKEFITYESSLSDIFGVILFNFITLNDNIGTQSFGFFILELILILIVTFITTLGLAFLLSKIKHHVKYVPIILIIVLIYAISEVYHLPALIFILLFGLFLGNLDELRKNPFIYQLRPGVLDREVRKFKELTGEIAFLIRSLFFLLFGYLIETSELMNSSTILWAVAISVGIFSLRFLFLTFFKLPLRPLLFMAPRGLITILLFLSIPFAQQIEIANKSLIIQVILITAGIMMAGLITHKKKDSEINTNDDSYSML